MKQVSFIFFLMIGIITSAQTPVVENVKFEQRTDGTLMVDIFYDVATVSDLPLEIIVEASDDEGASWDLPCTSLTGDVGDSIFAGTDKHVIWDFYDDNPNVSGSGYEVRVTAHCMVCGQTITEDFTLTRDLDCPPAPVPVIGIGASNITLDLGGHTMRGEFYNDIREYIIAQDVNEIVIKNGVLDGFINGIILGNSDYSVVENMTIRNLEIIDPERALTGIVFSGCDSVLIKNCQFEFLFTAHKEAVISGNSSFTVKHIITNNGSVGVNYGGSIDAKLSTGTVTDCRFKNSSLAGVLVQQTDNAFISNNVFESSSLSLDAAVPGIVSNVKINGNELYNRPDGDGIQFVGGDASIVSNNIIHNFLTGIAVYPSRGCGADSLNGAICSYPTGNLITNNTLYDNAIDLFHNEMCLGNTWQNNTYTTAIGSEIYNLGPSTARYGLATVDSIATSLYPDAKLLHVAAGNIDTLGRAFQWNYFYKSASQNNYYEFWFQDGRVIDRGVFTESWLDNFLPVPTSWLDSDSVFIVADSMGGRAFRNEFKIETIEMGLQNTGTLYWSVHFIAQDTFFNAEIAPSLINN